MRLHKSHKSRSKPIDFKDPSDWIAYNEGEHYIGYSKIEKKGEIEAAEGDRYNRKTRSSAA